MIDGSMFDLTVARDVDRLFRSGGRARYGAEEPRRLAYAVRNGFVSAEAFGYAETPLPDRADDPSAAAVLQWAKRGYQTDLTVRLKWWAWNWAVSIGAVPAFEVQKRDLSDPVSGVWIECGNAMPRIAYSAWSASGSETWRTVALFPKAPAGLAWRFAPTEAGWPVLDAYHRWRIAWLTHFNHPHLAQPPSDPGEPFNLGSPVNPVPEWTRAR